MTPASSSPVPPDDLLVHAEFVRGLACALVSGDADADDVVQETWVAALGSRNSRIRSPRSWLASIVRRRAARHHRTRARMDKRHAEGATAVEVPTPDDIAARYEIIQRVSAALAALPAPYRDALVLRYYEELPPREVAKRLEIPVETARTRIRRGLVRLREILDGKHDGSRAAWAMPLAGLLSAGTGGVGIGAMVVGGIAVAALLVLGFTLAPWPGATEAPPPVEQAERVPDEVAAPTLTGRGEPASETADVSGLAPPADAAIETSAKTGEAATPEDPAADKVEVVVRVVDEKGQPVEGLGIREHLRGVGGPLDIVTRPVGRTDATGRAVVLASPGAIGFGIEKNDAWQVERGHGVVPEPGEEVVLRVVPTLVLRGCVVDEGGAPIEGVRVLARFHSRSDPDSTRMSFMRLNPTDADGRFAVAVPAYASEVQLRAWSDGAIAEIAMDPHGQRDVVLRVRHPLRIGGAIVNEDGSPLIRPDHLKPTIRATPEGGGEEHNGGLIGSSNRFWISVPEKGRYRVSVTFPGNDPTAPATPDADLVEAPVEGLELVCPTGHRLTGHVAGENVSGFDVTWLRRRPWARGPNVGRYTGVDDEGRFTLTSLLDGDTILFVHRRGDDRYGLLERVRLPAEDLTIELRRGRTIRGHVRDYPGRHGFGLWLYFTWRGPSIPIEVDDDGTFTVAGLPPGTYGIRWQRAGKEGDLDLDVEAGAEDIALVLPEEVLRMGQTPEK